jgi:hypothetical protein
MIRGSNTLKSLELCRHADADAMVCLQEGVVAEEGTHGALIQQGGLYAQMWARQAEAAAVEEITGPQEEPSKYGGSEGAASVGDANGSD